MDYTVTIYIKKGVYKEKLVIPSWVKNVQLVGEDSEKTIITYDDHANICLLYTSSDERTLYF